MPEKCMTIFNEASEFGIYDGVSVPLRSDYNIFSLFSAVADGSPIERQTVIQRHGGTIMVLASLIHERALELFLGMKNREAGEASLTFREKEVLQWIGSGKTSEDVATILNIQPSTVDKHMHNIMTKFHCSTRTHAAVRGVTSGLINPI
jgi:DNA-binding CsgD family transcriptional regulator